MARHSQFKWKQYLKENRSDINIVGFTSWCAYSRTKKSIFDTEQELLETLQLYDNRIKQSQFNWKQYLRYNRPDINLSSFESWCRNNRPKKQTFDVEQELLETIIKYDNIKRSDFNWRIYLKENRTDIDIRNFAAWCHKHRPNKQIFNTEQELLQTLQVYDNRIKHKLDFDYKMYIQQERPDIVIEGFKSWCTSNRPKKVIFNTEQELLQTLQLYDNRQRQSYFKWKQYLQQNRPDINAVNFAVWCTKHRPNKNIFDTEQELLQAIQSYNNKKEYKASQFTWRQYLKENRPDINIKSFIAWIGSNRPKKSIFDTEQELLQAISLYDISKKYLIRKTQYNGIYNLIEKETGLRFNFYKLEDMLGLIQ